MTEIVTAVYENGVLRPTRPLPLRERQTVRLQLLSEESTDQAEQLVQRLIAAGLMRPSARWSDEPPPDPVSETERRELAELLGRAPGRPLSEIIVEERGER